MESVLNRLEEVLKPFKSAEVASSEKFFHGDEVARQIIAAWSALPLTIHEPFAFGSVPEHRHNQWKYAWAFRKIDYRDLEKSTGIADRHTLQEKVTALINHQMIYPDGAISRAAQALLAEKHG